MVIGELDGSGRGLLSVLSGHFLSGNEENHETFSRDGR
jgi:hypothetical protein